MSVLINMKMPTSCEDCPMCHSNAEYDYAYCCVSSAETSGNEIPSKCPLVSVPPHGDLIDRNELYDKTEDWEAQALHMVEVHMNDEDNTEWRKWSTVLTERSAFKFDVADAPTVIPAESDGV